MNLAIDYSASLCHDTDLYRAIQIKKTQISFSYVWMNAMLKKKNTFIAIKAAYFPLLKVRGGPDAVCSQEMTMISVLLSEKHDPNCTQTH